MQALEQGMASLRCLSVSRLCGDKAGKDSLVPNELAHELGNRIQVRRSNGVMRKEIGNHSSRPYIRLVEDL